MLCYFIPACCLYRVENTLSKQTSVVGAGSHRGHQERKGVNHEAAKKTSGMVARVLGV